MSKLITLLMLPLFLFACDKGGDSGGSLTDAERKQKTERLVYLQKELEGVKMQITKVNADIASSTGGAQIAYRERLQNLMHRKGEIEREITRLKKELNL